MQKEIKVCRVVLVLTRLNGKETGISQYKITSLLSLSLAEALILLPSYY